MKTLLLTLGLISSFASIAGVLSTGEPLTKWNKLSLTVCWLDDEKIKDSDFHYQTLRTINELESSFIKAPDKLKLNIQSAIEREYTKSRTGIHFVGWKSCQMTPSSDVQILIGNENDAFEGKASFGRAANINDSYDLIGSNQKAYVYLSTKIKKNIRISQTAAIVSTAIHEFGHIAGLRHEHIRMESNNCYRTEEAPLNPTAFFSAYDPSSIMNYCLSDFIEDEVGLNFYVQKDSSAGLAPNPKLPTITTGKMKKYTDKTIFTSKSAGPGFVEYKVNIGLSQGDVHGLKCLYVYGKIESKLKCHQYNRI